MDSSSPNSEFHSDRSVPDQTLFYHGLQDYSRFLFGRILRWSMGYRVGIEYTGDPENTKRKIVVIEYTGGVAISSDYMNRQRLPRRGDLSRHPKEKEEKKKIHTNATLCIQRHILTAGDISRNSHRSTPRGAMLGAWSPEPIHRNIFRYACPGIPSLR